MLDDFIARAVASGQRKVELECFAQNGRALRLYQGRGFAALHPLHEYRRAAGAGFTAAAGGEALDLEQAFACLERASGADGGLPLQVTPASLRALPAALQAVRRGTAQLLFSQGADGALVLHSLVDSRPGQRDAEALVAGVLAQHPDCAATVPQLQRPDLGGQALERLGFERLPLHQLLLRRTLA